MPRPVHALTPGSRYSSSFALLTCLICSSLLIWAPTQADRGHWTALQDLDITRTDDIAIHLTLLRGDGAPYHSRVLWWAHQGSVGGVLGWQPGNDACNDAPLSTFTALGAWNPGADIFCGGMCTLGSGEFLSIGGSDKVQVWGLNDARSYSASAGSWTERAKMRYSRFYPTATLLKDGRVIGSWGARYGQLWAFGGRRETGTPR